MLVCLNRNITDIISADITSPVSPCRVILLDLPGFFREGSDQGPGSALWGPAVAPEEWAGTDPRWFHLNRRKKFFPEHWNRLP